jgi:hypothetical protein
MKVRPLEGGDCSATRAFLTEQTSAPVARMGKS